MLTSLRIQGFRCFHDLTIERLGCVNLVTGCNNVGKTCLLEAVRLYSTNRALNAIESILSARDELGGRPRGDGNTADVARALGALFYGRSPEWSTRQSARIGPADASLPNLALTKELRAPSSRDRAGQLALFEAEAVADGEPVAGLRVDKGTGETLFVPLSWFHRRPMWDRIESGEAAPKEMCHYESPSGFTSGQVAELYDAIALTPLEADVLDALRVIAPEVMRLSLKGSGVRDERVPWILTDGAESPLPLRSMGDGMTRMFELTVGLVNAAGGVFLAEEIENGLHFTVQSDLWRLVFRTAARLGVQVFASTHSWDCIAGFQEAAAEHEAEGMLVRLDNRGGEVRAFLFDEEDLAVVTKQRIEPR